MICHQVAYAQFGKSQYTITFFNKLTISYTFEYVMNSRIWKWLKNFQILRVFIFKVSNICTRVFPENHLIQAKDLLERSFRSAETPTGAQKYHRVIPDGEATSEFGKFWFPSDSRIYKLFICVRKCQLIKKCYPI